LRVAELLIVNNGMQLNLNACWQKLIWRRDGIQTVHVKVAVTT